MNSRYVPRLVDQLIAELLAEFPALLHTGPRAFPLDDRIIAAPVAALWN